LFICEAYCIEAISSINIAFLVHHLQAQGLAVFQVIEALLFGSDIFIYLLDLSFQVSLLNHSGNIQSGKLRIKNLNFSNTLSISHGLSTSQDVLDIIEYL